MRNATSALEYMTLALSAIARTPFLPPACHCSSLIILSRVLSASRCSHWADTGGLQSGRWKAVACVLLEVVGQSGRAAASDTGLLKRLLVHHLPPAEPAPSILRARPSLLHILINQALACCSLCLRSSAFRPYDIPATPFYHFFILGLFFLFCHSATTSRRPYSFANPLAVIGVGRDSSDRRSTSAAHAL
ncbi:hypothetical protein K461DRAFT_177088 [Myriangium duriaei CBS 260.36]|uniref:Uncharacterized protein n=1 Tax=Myriangium duriaei CBS 260.36 TaxID=1168546 RepID=A0A9P4MET8_9PEZI|nr:hypothetical protein K461DRAFT_177088 [Myriangium duriaei CBS 260.36]